MVLKGTHLRRISPGGRLLFLVVGHLALKALGEQGCS